MRRFEPLSHRDNAELRLARRAVRVALNHIRQACIRYGRLSVSPRVENLAIRLRDEDRRLTALILGLRP